MGDWKNSLVRAQQGDLAAFDAVVKQFQDMAVGYAYSILHDFGLAEDAAQEAFIQAYVDRDMLREPLAFPAWLRKLVFKQCDRITRRKKVITTSLDDTASLQDACPTPLEAVQQQETQNAVLSAVDALPKDQRTATTLFYINGYSLSEVGEFLDVSAVTVKSRLHSARTKLRERMIGLVKETLKQKAPGEDFHRRVHKGLRKVDWGDVTRQNEFVNSVVSALGGLGENLDYDYVCAVSGSAFRTSFSVTGWNHGNYHVINTPIVIEHTFKMLGYEVSNHARGDYEADSRLIMDSIDKGVPVITLEGVINCADACVISGYDDNGDVLLGWSPFMYLRDDHPEAPDDTGYFRKTDWHDGFFADCKGRILIIEGKCEKPDKQTILVETIKLISRLIREESLVPGQHNGLAAHKAFADALLTYAWDDNYHVYLNVMCNYKQYLDRQYAVRFFRDHGRDDLAGCCEEIVALCAKLGQIIPQDFSATDMFSDKDNLKPYCDVLLQIRDLEERVLPLLG